MNRLRVSFGTMSVAILLGLLGIWTATAVPSTHALSADSIRTTTAISRDPAFGTRSRGLGTPDAGLGARGSERWTWSAEFGTLGPLVGLRGSEWAIPGGGASPDGEEADDFSVGQTADGYPLSEDARLIDVYGNEIETAFEDYRIDGRGEIYERHSPDTAVPRMAAAGV